MQHARTGPCVVGELGDKEGQPLLVALRPRRLPLQLLDSLLCLVHGRLGVDLGLVCCLLLAGAPPLASAALVNCRVVAGLRRLFELVNWPVIGHVGHGRPRDGREAENLKADARSTELFLAGKICDKKRT